MAGHAAWGGASSMLNGGSFWSGAAVGAVSNWVGGMTNGMGAGVQIGASSLMGGIIADATGGSFWHGAAVGGIVAGAIISCIQTTLEQNSENKRKKKLRIS